jgi:uncharacterized protein
MQTYTDPVPFLERAQPFLETQESANGLILGVALRLRERPERSAYPPYLATVDSAAGELNLVAVMTPVNNILLSGAAQLEPAALQALAENLLANGWQVPGVTAENHLAQGFAETFARLAEKTRRTAMRLRAYELREVIPPPNPPAGFLRPATLADLETLIPWRAEFTRESLHEEPPDDLREMLTHLIQTGGIVIWEDGGPVSTAAKTRPTPHGASVGAVYTPPAFRGRGYASACVAALSQQILDSGKDYCTLFTDLDYPTSNSIYQKIGYRPLCDFYTIHFE